MSLNIILMGVLPLIAFVMMDTFFGLKAGLVSAIGFAFLELLYTLYKFGTIDAVTGLSLSLVCLMAFFAWKKESEKLFLYQPVLMSLVLGAYFIISYTMGEPIFIVFFQKYGKDLIPQEQYQVLSHPQMQKIMTISSLTLGFGLFAHAFAIWIAIVKLNKWWWLAFRGIGFYLFAFISMLVARFLI